MGCEWQPSGREFHIPRIAFIQLLRPLPQSILPQKEGSDLPGFLFGQATWFPKRHGSKNVPMQVRRGRKFLQRALTYQRRNLCGQSKTILIRSLAMAARVPAIAI